MTQRYCLACYDEGKRVLTDARRPYCARHRAVNEAKRGPRPQYNAEWKALSKAARDAHPYCSVQGCPSMDLTLDHGTGLVVCRGHNTAWRNTGYSRTT